MNQFHDLLTKFHFLKFHKFLNWEKFKTAKDAILHKDIWIYLISRVFFCLDFFKFSGTLWRALCNLEIVLPGGLDGKVFVQRPFCVFEVVD